MSGLVRTLLMVAVVVTATSAAAAPAPGSAAAAAGPRLRRARQLVASLLRDTGTSRAVKRSPDADPSGEYISRYLRQCCVQACRYLDIYSSAVCRRVPVGDCQH